MSAMQIPFPIPAAVPEFAISASHGMRRVDLVAAAPELTILVPCFNESHTLPTGIDKAHGFLRRTGVVGEVLDADNGSTAVCPDLFLDRLRDGAQAVMRNRFASGIQAGATPPRHRYLGNSVLTIIDHMLFGSRDLAEFTRGNIKALWQMLAQIALWGSAGVYRRDSSVFKRLVPRAQAKLRGAF